MAPIVHAVRFREHDGQVRRVDATDATSNLPEHRLRKMLANRNGPPIPLRSSGTWHGY